MIVVYYVAKIQSLKKSVGKGDKKRKKEVNLEIAKLENEIQVLRQSSSNEPSGIESEPTVDVLIQQMSLNKSKSKAQRKRVSFPTPSKFFVALNCCISYIYHFTQCSAKHSMNY